MAVAFGVIVTTAAMPFAVVSDVLVAGIFSLVNTVLNGITLYFLSKAQTERKAVAAKLDVTTEVAAEAAAIVAKELHATMEVAREASQDLLEAVKEENKKKRYRN